MRFDECLLLLTAIVSTVRCLPLGVALYKEADLNVIDKLRKEISVWSQKSTSQGNDTTKSINIDDVIYWQRGPDSYEVTFNGFRSPVTIRRSLRSSVAEPWPKPRVFKPTRNFYRMYPQNFTIVVKSHSCDIIDDAILRYNKIIFEDSIEVSEENYFNAPKSKIKNEMSHENLLYFLDTPSVPHVHIRVKKECTEYPNATSDESYLLTVTPTGVKLDANEVWGVIRGLETLSQLVVTNAGQFYIHEAVIRDAPRFKYRGFLLDTARHFITKQVILDVLEGMAQNKMNVLHWHMVDDQSFPYKSDIYPDLSKKGAYHSSMVYTRNDIADIIEFARLRGIRVIPEFDTPGHTYSWGFADPDLLTQCYPGKEETVPGFLGPMDPSNEHVFTFLAQFFKEVLTVFKDPYIHLGNDEVFTECWASNPKVIGLFQKLYFEKGMEEIKTAHSTDNSTLQVDIRLLNRGLRTMSEEEQDKVLPKYVWDYYVKRLREMFKKLEEFRQEKMEFIMWEDALRENISIPKDTIIQVWRTDNYLRRVLLEGFRVIYSYCWYLDRIDPGVHWRKFYQCDPYDGGRYANDKAILGGEVCMWGEYMSSEMLMKWLWPRGSAAAERLWSRREDTLDLFDAARRLAEQRCRMLRRGLDPGFANGPEFCLRKNVSRRKSHSRNHVTDLSANHNSVFQYPIIDKKQTVPCESDKEVLFLSFMTPVSVFVVIFLICLHRKRRMLRC
ncbi:beta-hexosaminidase subunit beta-like [Mizuhopecten yessoensis]|uniref:beta-hexosaminidase subunit beta-like n=1 Tax=Mizuhopecten yessoensis TaxID=6573 RepID=UPI000B4590DC|nr:beta-hexosaminidase subunit beta-like [Mizuhopecten yessoensis]